MMLGLANIAAPGKRSGARSLRAAALCSGGAGDDEARTS